MTRRLLAALVAALLLGMLASPAHADTYDEYRSRVEAAYDVVSGSTTLVETEGEAEALADEVDGLLPGSERVEVDGVSVDVDDSVVTALTTELRTARTEAERRDAVERLARHLASLSSAVGAGEPGESGTAFPEDPAALDELLSSGQELEEPWFAEVARAAIAWLEELLSGFNIETTPGGELLVEIVLWVIGIGLVGLLVWLVLRAIRARRERPVVPEIEGAEGDAIVAAAEGLPEDPLSYADRLAGEGRFRDAVRALFGGAARELVRFGVVRQTRTMTNGELVRAVRRGNARIHEPLRLLAGDFEIAWYGHIEPDRAGYDAARERYRQVVTEAGPRGGGAQ